MTRRSTPLALVAASAVLVAAPAQSADSGHWERHKLPWYRSIVVKHDRVVRMAVALGGGDAVVQRAKVRSTPRTVRISLWRRSATGPTNAIRRDRCVEVHLRFPVDGRVRVDGGNDLAPDRGRGRSAITDLMRKAKCTVLRVRYLPPWRHHDHWREER